MKINKIDGIKAQLILSTYKANLYFNESYLISLSKIETLIWTFIDGSRSFYELVYDTGLEEIVIKSKLDKFEKMGIIEKYYD